MTQPDIIQTIFKDSHYHLALFSDNEIQALKEQVFTKTIRGKETQFVNCIIRDKDIQLKPEEIVRQLYAARLIKQYGYSKNALPLNTRLTSVERRKVPILSSLTKTVPIPPPLLYSLVYSLPCSVAESQLNH